MSVKIICTIMLFTAAIDCNSQYNRSDSLLMKEIQSRKDRNNNKIDNPYPLLRLLAERTGRTSSDLEQKVIFINFWYASCPPCVREFRGLNKLYEALKTNKNFIFLSFTFDDLATVNHTIKRFNIPYKPFSITRADCYKLNLGNGFPTSILINGKGNVCAIYEGASESEPESSRFFSGELLSTVTRLLDAL